MHKFILNIFLISFFSITLEVCGQYTFTSKAERVVIYDGITKDEVSKSINSLKTSFFIDANYSFFKIGEQKYVTYKKEFKLSDSFGEYIKLTAKDKDFLVVLEYYLKPTMIYLDFVPMKEQMGKFIVYY